MQVRRPSALAGKKLTDLDTDGDGSISQAELAGSLEQNAPAGVSTDQADAAAANLFQKIDANGDGKISTDEWNSFQQQIQAPHHGHHHHHAKDAQDASNGQDSSTASAQGLTDSLFQAADANGDGTLTKAELQAWLTQAVAAQSPTGIAGFGTGGASGSLLNTLA
jgi:Ca2+-binding EF-hand superfamily protein